MKSFLRSAITGLIVSSALPCAALAQGVAAQPPADAASQAPKPQQQADKPQKDEPDPLLTDPSAVEVAVFRCSPLVAACPLTAADVTAIAGHFQQPLKTGTGTNTALANALVDVLGKSYNNEPVWDASAPYAAIHIVDLKGDADAIVHDRWFLATRHKGAIALSQERRILGARRVTVVFVYVNAPAPPGAQDQGDPDVNIRKAYGDLSYRAIVKPKRSTAFEHLLDVFRLASANFQATGAEPQGFLGYGTLTDVATPSDVTVLGVRTSTMKIVGQTVQYDNEGKSIWDASIAVPVNKITLLDYSDEDGTFVPKQLNKQSIYGVIDVYPVPVDLKAGNARWVIPRLIAGLGLTGRPGENVLVGVALGIPELQFFAGRTFTNHRVPIEGADPSNGANFTQKYDKSWSFGINLPVVSALKKATAKSDSKKSGS